MVEETAVLFGAAIALGIVHGAEPGHGWPIAATYALDRSNKWRNGLLASTLLGLGHLVSSLAVVGAFFLAKEYFELSTLNDPFEVGGVEIGGPLGVVAGLLLIGLGVREYYRGHGHDHETGHEHGLERAHEHDHEAVPEHDHETVPEHDHETVPEHDHETVHGRDHETVHGRDHETVHGRERDSADANGSSHRHADDLDRTGLVGIVWTAFVLGFVHEEEFEIIGLCIGSTHCLELMLVYAVAVLLSLVGLTMLLIAGYYRYEERVEGLAEYFPAISATVLVAVGLGFVLGVL